MISDLNEFRSVQSGSYRDSSVSTGLVLGPEWWREEVAEEWVSEVGGGLVMEGSVGEEKDFKLDVLGKRELILEDV